MELSVLVVSWNTRDLLRRCLQSIRENSGALRLEVIVVDNDSSDGSSEMVALEFPEARLVRNNRNLGFARANNQAAEWAGGRYLLLLNPDTELLEGALETLVRFMEGTPLAGAAGARLLNPDMSLQECCYPLPTLARELWRLFHLDALHRWARYPMERWHLNQPVEVEAAQGACLILRREALDQVGLLDEEYFIYSEEVDLCQRLRAVGWKVYWEPRAAVIHYTGMSTAQMAGPMFLRLYQGKTLFFRKHHGETGARLYKLVLLLAGAYRLLLAPLALFERAPRRTAHLGLARRYWSLIKALPSL